MPGQVPDDSWLGRVFESNEVEPLGIEAGLWAVVTKCGDRADGDAAEVPLKGLRLVLYKHEMDARVVSARALKQQNGAQNITEVQRKYAQRRPAAATLTLKALSAKDAGKIGGNRAAARSYWTELEAREGRTHRHEESSTAAAQPTPAPAATAPASEATAPAPAATAPTPAAAAPAPAAAATASPAATAEQDWPQWCADAGGERGPYSLRSIQLGRAFGGAATVGGRSMINGIDTYFVRLHNGAISTFPAQVVECALQGAEQSSAAAWLKPGGSRGGEVQIAPYTTIAKVVLGPMLKKHTPGKTLVAAAALKELAVAAGASIAKLGLPSSDTNLSPEDGARIAIALEFRLMRLFRGEDQDAEPLEASPSPLKRAMRRRAAGQPSTPGSASSAAPPSAESSIDIDEMSARKRKAQKRVHFADDDAGSDDATESLFETLTMALNESEYTRFVSDAVALLHLDISPEHVGRFKLNTHMHQHA